MDYRTSSDLKAAFFGAGKRVLKVVTFDASVFDELSFSRLIYDLLCPYIILMVALDAADYVMGADPYSVGLMVLLHIFAIPLIFLAYALINGLIIHVSARLVGGTGNYWTTMAALGYIDFVWTAGMTVCFIAINPTNGIPSDIAAMSIAALILMTVFSLLTLAQNVLAVSKIHRLGMLKALVATIIIPIAMSIVIGVLIFAGMMGLAMIR
jgi:hypothetical protein